MTENFKQGLLTFFGFFLVGCPFVFWKFMASDSFKVEYDEWRILMNLPFWFAGYYLFFLRFGKLPKSKEKSQTKEISMFTK